MWTMCLPACRQAGVTKTFCLIFFLLAEEERLDMILDILEKEDHTQRTSHDRLYEECAAARVDI